VVERFVIFTGVPVQTESGAVKSAMILTGGAGTTMFLHSTWAERSGTFRVRIRMLVKRIISGLVVFMRDHARMIPGKGIKEK
jgi:hypothetical protein